MGPGKNASRTDLDLAFALGERLAEEGFIVLTGGRASGVMEAALKGAKSAGGITMGILPSEDGKDRSHYADIAIKTGIGSARNNINVLTADVVVGIGSGLGTTSEISLAMKADKPVVLLNQQQDSITFYKQFRYSKLQITSDVGEAVNSILKALSI